MKSPIYLTLIIAPTITVAEAKGYGRKSRKHEVVTPRTVHRMKSNHRYVDVMTLGDPRFTPKQARQIQAHLHGEFKDELIEELWDQVDE